MKVRRDVPALLIGTMSETLSTRNRDNTSSSDSLIETLSAQPPLRRAHLR